MLAQPSLPETYRSQQGDRCPEQGHTARLRDGRRTDRRHHGGLVRRVRDSSRSVEVHIDSESEPVHRIARENGHRPCCVGEHAEGECAAGSRCPIGRTQRRPEEANLKRKCRAVGETFEVIVEARPVVEAHGSWQGSANIAGQRRASRESSVRGEIEDFERCCLGHQRPGIEFEIDRPRCEGNGGGIDGHVIGDRGRRRDRRKVDE